MFFPQLLVVFSSVPQGQTYPKGPLIRLGIPLVQLSCTVSLTIGYARSSPV